MSMKSLIPLTLTVALAVCSCVQLAPAPGAGTPRTSASAAALDASLPFKTVAVDEDGQGQFFKAGVSEGVVLRSKADLDAFIARRAPAVAPQYGPPNPDASPTPPPSTPDGTPPPFVAAPLPKALLDLDFSQQMAIAFFNGNVKVASASRITAVQDQGDKLVVSVRRWDPPPTPAAIADTNGRLHVIALPRTDKPVTFSAVEVVDGASPPGGGGYGVGGNPTMRPQWPAVANPEITREVVEKVARGWVGASNITSIELDLVPLASVKMVGAAHTRFTPDSLVWFAQVHGDLALPGSYGPSPGVAVGGPPTVPQTDLLISPEDGTVLMASTRGEVKQSQGFEFHLRPEGDWRLGETLRFDVKGPLVEGTLTLTLRSGSAPPVVHPIAFKDLAAFALVLDSAHVPLLTGEAVQTLTVELKYGAGTTQNVTDTREVRILRDAGPQSQSTVGG